MDDLDLCFDVDGNEVDPTPEKGVLILDLTRASCRAIIGRHDGMAVYCGVDKTTTAYCDEHAALYYVPSRGGGGYQRVKDVDKDTSAETPEPEQKDKEDNQLLDNFDEED